MSNSKLANYFRAIKCIEHWQSALSSVLEWVLELSHVTRMLIPTVKVSVLIFLEVQGWKPHKLIFRESSYFRFGLELILPNVWAQIDMHCFYKAAWMVFINVFWLIMENKRSIHCYHTTWYDLRSPFPIRSPSNFGPASN